MFLEIRKEIIRLFEIKRVTLMRTPKRAKNIISRIY